MLGDFVMEITAMMGICSCSIDEQTHRDWNQGLTGNDSVGDFLHLSFYLTGARLEQVIYFVLAQVKDCA